MKFMILFCNWLTIFLQLIEKICNVFPKQRKKCKIFEKNFKFDQWLIHKFCDIYLSTTNLQNSQLFSMTDKGICDCFQQVFDNIHDFLTTRK